MIIYTLNDYLKIYKIIEKNTYKLREDEEKYLIQEKNNHNKHDKIFRDILNDKKEVARIINTYIKPKTKLSKENIEKYETRYITKTYEEKEADIVYKIKGKEIFFLIEHQTKVDKKMAYRILEYSMETIEQIYNNLNREEDRKKFLEIIDYLLEDEINKETLEELKEKIIKEGKGGIEMMHAKEVLRRDRLKAIKDGENRGVIKGKLIIAKKMLEEKLDIDFIAKVTGLSRSEIEKL